jgi:uncharacterized protein (TIGR03437 family)
MSAASAQQLTRQDVINLRPPAINDNGLSIFFAAAIRADSQRDTATNLHRWIRLPSAATVERLTNYVSETSYAGVSSVTYPGTGELVVYTALPDPSGNREEVRVINLTNHTDRLLAADTEGCIQPLCVDCFRACLRSVHLTPDGRTALYEASRDRPFYTVQTDQSAQQRLETYQGSLAPSPQRVIADGGTVVFTSAAPFGPTLVAAAADVYLMNLDGTNVRQVTRFNNAQFAAHDAVISRNGARIAFAANFSESGPLANTQIFVINADGTGMRRLSAGTGAAKSPSISADGSMVSYVQDRQVWRASTLTDPVALVAPVALTDFSISEPGHTVISNDAAQVAFALGPVSGTPAAVYRAATTETRRNLRQLTPIYTPRVLFQNGVRSAAGNAVASPGSLITMYGANLGLDELVVAPGFPLPMQLKEVTALVNDQPMPLHSVTPWQINAHLAQSVGPGTPGFKVRYEDGVAVQAVNGEVKAIAPENFFYTATNAGQAYVQAHAYHPGTLTPADAANPARAGEVLEIYGLGLGVTNPVIPAGVASPVPPAIASTTPQLEIGGRAAAITFAGLIPGLAGVYQVNATVPSGLARGFHNLTWIQPDGSRITYSGIFVQ